MTTYIPFDYLCLKFDENVIRNGRVMAQNARVVFFGTRCSKSQRQAGVSLRAIKRCDADSLPSGI